MMKRAVLKLFAALLALLTALSIACSPHHPSEPSQTEAALQTAVPQTDAPQATPSPTPEATPVPTAEPTPTPTPEPEREQFLLYPGSSLAQVVTLPEELGERTLSKEDVHYIRHIHDAQRMRKYISTVSDLLNWLHAAEPTAELLGSTLSDRVNRNEYYSVASMMERVAIGKDSAALLSGWLLQDDYEGLCVVYANGVRTMNSMAVAIPVEEGWFVFDPADFTLQGSPNRLFAPCIVQDLSDLWATIDRFNISHMEESYDALFRIDDLDQQVTLVYTDSGRQMSKKTVCTEIPRVVTESMLASFSEPFPDAYEARSAGSDAVESVTLPKDLSECTLSREEVWNLINAEPRTQRKCIATPADLINWLMYLDPTFLGLQNTEVSGGLWQYEQPEEMLRGRHFEKNSLAIACLWLLEDDDPDACVLYTSKRDKFYTANRDRAFFLAVPCADGWAVFDPAAFIGSGGNLPFAFQTVSELSDVWGYLELYNALHSERYDELSVISDIRNIYFYSSDGSFAERTAREDIPHVLSEDMQRMVSEATAGMYGYRLDYDVVNVRQFVALPDELNVHTLTKEQLSKCKGASPDELRRMIATPADLLDWCSVLSKRLANDVDVRIDEHEFEKKYPWDIIDWSDYAKDSLGLVGAWLLQDDYQDLRLIFAAEYIKMEEDMFDWRTALSVAVPYADGWLVFDPSGFTKTGCTNHPFIFLTVSDLSDLWTVMEQFNATSNAKYDVFFCIDDLDQKITYRIADDNVILSGETVYTVIPHPDFTESTENPSPVIVPEAKDVPSVIPKDPSYTLLDMTALPETLTERRLSDDEIAALTMTHRVSLDELTDALSTFADYAAWLASLKEHCFTTAFRPDDAYYPLTVDAKDLYPIPFEAIFGAVVVSLAQHCLADDYPGMKTVILVTERNGKSYVLYGNAIPHGDGYYVLSAIPFIDPQNYCRDVILPMYLEDFNAIVTFANGSDIDWGWGDAVMQVMVLDTDAGMVFDFDADTGTYRLSQKSDAENAVTNVFLNPTDRTE